MYKIALCDNNINYMQHLESKIKSYCQERGIPIYLQSFTDSDSVMDHIEEKNMFDIYILELDMPCYSGIEITKKIREHSNTAAIIFLSNHTGYAVDGYGLDVFRYVLKDDTEQNWEKILDDLFSHADCLKDDRVYIISNQKKYVKLYLDDIVYIYKDNKNAVFILQNGQKETERKPLRNVYQNLNRKNMILLDKGIILNIHYVKAINGCDIELHNNIMLTTSKPHIEQLKRMLLALSS